MAISANGLLLATLLTLGVLILLAALSLLKERRFQAKIGIAPQLRTPPPAGAQAEEVVLRFGNSWELFPVGYAAFWAVLLLVIHIFGHFGGVPSDLQGRLVAFLVMFFISAGVGWLLFPLFVGYRITLREDGLGREALLRAPLTIPWEAVGSIDLLVAEYGGLSAFIVRAERRKMTVYVGLKSIDAFARRALEKVPKERWKNPELSLTAASRIAGKPVPAG